MQPQGAHRSISEALIDAGVTRVVFGQPDPNAQAAGGADALRSAGVLVTDGFMADAAQTLNADWTLAMTRQRPEVTWKLATLDGWVADSERK